MLGAGGFIGGHLCRELLRCGAAVHGFGRRRAYPEALAGVRWTAGEFSDRAALARAMDGAEYVFHLIGGSIPESSNKDPVADLIAGPVASLHMLEMCRATAAVRKIVFVSSGGTIYGVPRRTPIREDAPTDPISAYGVGKLAVEKYLHVYQHLYGLDYAVLRVANPFGPWQDPDRRQGVVAALTRAMLDGRPVEIWGDGRVVRDYLYAADVAEAISAAAIYAGPHRVFNVGSGVGRSVLDLVRDIAAALGREGGVDIVHKPGRATDVPVNVLDTSLIRQEMGWAPGTPWPAALDATIAWMRCQTAG